VAYNLSIVPEERLPDATAAFDEVVFSKVRFFPGTGSSTVTRGPRGMPA